MTESRRVETVDLDAEREVDLGSAWRRIAARWWLPVVGLVVGAALGVLVALGGGDVYQAKTLMYLGQPFTPGGGSQIVSLQTNPKAVSEIIRSEAAIARAAAASGLRPGQLRGNVTSTPVVQVGQIANRTLSPLVEVVVRAPTRGQAEKAAASFAVSVLNGIAGYVDNKMTLLAADIKQTQASIDQANERIAAAQEQQRQAQTNSNLSLAERLLIQANINTTLQFYEQRSQVLRAEQTESEQLLSLAKEVEKTRVLEGDGPCAPTRRAAAIRWPSAVCSGCWPGPRRLLAGPVRSAQEGARGRLTQSGCSRASASPCVVPAYNEELLVAETLRGIPDFVDRIVVVDDRSTDATVERARSVADPRVDVIVHDVNGGVGAAILTGYERCRDEGIDVTCVMAADNQMDPAELVDLVTPVARGETDYTKANRLFTGEAWTLIPRARYLGNAALSLLTKIASGYWHVADSQAGYTALSLDVLRRLDLQRVYRRYGFPNDVLVHLNVANARVRDVPSRPIYGVGERSGIKIRRVAPRIAWLLFKGFWWRLKEKYVIRDFHPLVFFYVLGALMTAVGLALGMLVSVERIFLDHQITTPTIVLVALLLISGTQFTLFAMWFDQEANKELR